MKKIMPCIADGILCATLFRLRNEPKENYAEILSEEYYRKEDIMKAIEECGCVKQLKQILE